MKLTNTDRAPDNVFFFATEAQHFFPGLIHLRPECFLPGLVIGGLYTAQCGSRSNRAIQEQREVRNSIVHLRDLRSGRRTLFNYAMKIQNICAIPIDMPVIEKLGKQPLVGGRSEKSTDAVECAVLETLPGSWGDTTGFGSFSSCAAPIEAGRVGRDRDWSDSVSICSIRRCDCSMLRCICSMLRCISSMRCCNERSSRTSVCSSAIWLDCLRSVCLL